MSIEEPAFRLRLREGRFEVRDYPALVVADVVVGGDQNQAASRGFRLLAGYIFGGNARRESIAMTAPVTLLPAIEGVATAAPVVADHAGGAWVVRFTMPKRYAIDALPPPKDARVRLHVVPPARFAVDRFSGLASPGDVRSRTVELNAWAQAHRLRATGAASLAQYDPPWTLWFLRRNEVMLPVAT